MAAATRDREAQRSDGKLKSYPAAAVKIYKGTLVSVNAAGYAKGGSDTAGEKFVGVAYEAVDNSAGAAGAKSLRLEKSGEYEFNFSGAATQANLGDPVYIVDDQTVGLAATTANDVLCGHIAEIISATVVRVRIDRAVQ